MKRCRRARAGRLFCVGIRGVRGHDIILRGGQGDCGLDGMPQGEHLEIVLHGLRRQEIVLSGRLGSSGSTSCRRAGAGKLFCVGGGENGVGDCSERGNGEFRLEELP